MKQGYVAVLIASAKEMPAFARDAVREIKAIAGAELTMSDAGHGTTVCAFISPLDHAAVRAALMGLWRTEERIWIFAAEGVVQGRGATLEWLRKRGAEGMGTLGR